MSFTAFTFLPESTVAMHCCLESVLLVLPVLADFPQRCQSQSQVAVYMWMK